MARERERRALSLVVEALEARVIPTPTWLVRPGEDECGKQWSLIQGLYKQLSPGLELPDLMRSVERRDLDAVLEHDGVLRVFEFDEKQHFNRFRAQTLRQYAHLVPLAFDPDEWISRSEQKTHLEGGEWGIPRPPLFDGEHGRHRQRAFRDALADIVPLEYGYAPTLRIGEHEVAGWLSSADAAARIRTLLTDKLTRG